MNQQEIIDDQGLQDTFNKREETRFARVVAIIVGVLFLLLGLVFLVGVSYDLYRFIKLINSSYYLNLFSWTDWLLNKSLSFLYMISFFIGGIGLLRRKIVGWVFGFATSFFIVFNIGFLVYMMGDSSVPGGLDIYGWILFGIALFFGLIVFFMMSKRARILFQPSPRSFMSVGIVVAVFAIDLISILLIFRWR